MATRLVFSVCLAMMVFFAKAQESFTFEYKMEEMVDVQNENQIDPHFLGEDIAVKMQLLRESYTWKEEDKLSMTERTVIEKSSIFYSVKKVSRYLKKELKKGNITKEEATTTLENILNIALNIRYQDTEKLEDILWKTKDPIEIASLYDDRITLEM